MRHGSNNLFTRLLGLAFFLFFLSDLYAFGSYSFRDTTKAHESFVLGMDKLNEGNTQEAMELFEEASRLFGKGRAWERVIECNLRRTDAWTELPDKNGLIEFWMETLSLSKEKLGESHVSTGDCYNRLGELYLFENENKKAGEFFEKALEVYTALESGETLNKAKVYTNLARLGLELSEYETIESYLERAEDIYLGRLDSLDRSLITTYHTYGRFYYYIGKMDQSIHYNKLVLEIERNKYGDHHPDLANAYNNLGAAYQRKGDFELALEVHQNALNIRLTLLDSLHPNVALSYNNLANVYTSMGDYEKSNDYHQIALRLRKQIFDDDHIDIGMSYTNLGNNQLNQGHYHKAHEYFMKAVSIVIKNYGPDHMLTADAIENAGIPYYYLGRLDSTFYYLYKALTIREGVEDGVNIKVARSYGNIGAIYKENRDYEMALSYYFKSAELYKKLMGEDSYALSGSYNNIGEVYYLTGDIEQSIVYYQKGLQIDIEHLGPENPKLAARYLNLASASSDLGNYEESKRYKQMALQLQIDAYGERNRLVSSIYHNIARDYDDLDSLDRALEYMKLAIEIREEVSDKSDPELANDYTRYGLLLAKKGRPDEGLKYINNGLSVNYFGELDKTFRSSIDPSMIKDIHLFIETLAALTEFNNKHQAGLCRPDRLRENQFIYEQIADLSIFLREAYRFEEAKLEALKQWDYLYTEAFETASDLYEITGDEGFFIKAFRFAGLKKASALSDAILASQALKSAGLPDSIILKEESLNKNLENLKLGLMELEESADKAEAADEIKSQINSTRIELNALYLTIEKEYPDYNSLRTRYPDYLPKEIAGLLDPHSLLIDFVVTDSAIYTIIIGKEGRWIERIEVPSNFESRVNDLLRTVKKFRVSDFIDQSAEIYEILMLPLEKHMQGIKKLITIPESYLLLLPLDILHNSSDGLKNGNLSDLDFFVKRVETVSHYSSDLWVRSKQKSKDAVNNHLLKGFLGLAPVFDFAAVIPDSMAIRTDTMRYADRSVVDRMSLQALPYSMKEVEKLVSMFADNGEQSAGLIRSEATEENFRKKAGEFRYVHIATHGLINPVKPELSGLVFWNDDTDSTEQVSQLLISARDNDGVLYTKEMFKLDLNAELITLSACETGAGQLVKGEGLLSFVRGFTCAGVPNLLISCWKVNDKTTVDFMHVFYSRVLSGDSFSSALRLAKLDAISNPATAFPVTWGNFVLIGN